MEIDLILERDTERPDFIWLRRDGEFISLLTGYALGKLGIELEPGQSVEVKLVI